MDVANWQWVRLHTSPDGRFVAELYDDDHATIPANGRVYDLHSDYIMVKGGDGTIPLMPTGESWLLKQEVTAGDNTTRCWLTTTQTRTVYSQRDSVYTDQTHTQNTATFLCVGGAAGGCGQQHQQHENQVYPAHYELNTVYGAPTL